MATTRRYKHIQHGSTDKGQQRIGGRCGNGDAGIADDRAEADAAGTNAGDDTHDACIERELQDDARSTCGSLGKGAHVCQRGAMQQDTQKKEQHDNTTQVEGASTESQMNNQIGETYQRHNPCQHLGMLHALSRCNIGFVGFDNGHVLFLQKGGVDCNHILLGVHEGVGDHDGHNNQRNDDQVVGIEDGTRDRNRAGKNPIGSLGEGFAGGGHGEGYRARQTGMPNHEATIGRSNK